MPTLVGFEVTSRSDREMRNGIPEPGRLKIEEVLSIIM